MAFIVFDIGSTLIHPDLTVLRDIVGSLADDVDRKHLARAFAYALEADQRILPLCDAATRQGTEFVRMLKPHSAPDVVFARHMWVRVRDCAGNGSPLYTELDPDAHLVLAALSQAGHQLFAASNSDGTLEAELQSFGLRQYFNAIIDSCDVGYEKPDPQFFHSVMSIVGAQAGESLWYVGNDPIRDVLSATMNGFTKAVLYDRSDSYPQLRSKFRITTLDQLMSLIMSDKRSNRE